MTISIPDGYEYVAAALVATAWLTTVQGVLVGRFRKRAGVKYPQMYAEKAEAAASKDAYKFNCAQRAHQNTLEHIPGISVTTLIAGTQYPVFAATACALWVLSRISYTRGYISGDPTKRVTPLYGVGTVAAIGLILGSTFTVGSWLYTRLA